jgi:hypothetical protein
MSDSGALRAADSDRERTAEQLRAHCAAGRITSDELDERLSAAYSAVTLADLAALSADLPALGMADAATTEPTRDVYRERARRRAYQALGSSLLLSLTCTVIWAITDPSGYFWPVWVVLLSAVRAASMAWRQLGPGGHAELGTLDRHDRRRLSFQQRADERREQRELGR